MFAIKRSKASPRESFTRIGADRIYSQVLGSGPPLVLIHGLGASTRWWGRNQRFLAEDYEVHLVDLAGFGRSSGRFVLDHATEQLAIWAQRYGLARFSVIGHSLGGYLSARLAAEQPQLIDRLVLVSAALRCPDLLPGGRSALWRSPFPFSMLQIALEDFTRAGPLVLARVAYELARADTRAILSQVRAHTLLVWGEHDSAVPLSVAHTALNYLPTARLAIICDVGHAPMWERPLAFNHTVRSFLCDLPIKSQQP